MFKDEALEDYDCCVIANAEYQTYEFPLKDSFRMVTARDIVDPKTRCFTFYIFWDSKWKI